MSPRSQFFCPYKPLNALVAAQWSSPVRALPLAILAFSGLVSQVQAAESSPYYRGRFTPELFWCNVQVIHNTCTLPPDILKAVVEDWVPWTDDRITWKLNIYKQHILPALGPQEVGTSMASAFLLRRTEYFRMLLQEEGKPRIQNDPQLAKTLYDTICAILFASLTEFDKPTDDGSKYDAGFAKVVTPMIEIVELALAEFPLDSHLGLLFLTDGEFVSGLMKLLKSPIEGERRFVTRIVEKSLRMLKEREFEHDFYCKKVLKQIGQMMADAQQAEGNQAALRPMSEIPDILELILPHTELGELIRFTDLSLLPSFGADLFGDALEQMVEITLTIIQRVSEHYERADKNLVSRILRQAPSGNDRGAEESMFCLWINCIRLVPMDSSTFTVFLMRILRMGRNTVFLETERIVTQFLDDELFNTLLARHQGLALKVFFQELWNWQRQRYVFGEEISTHLLAIWERLQDRYYSPSVFLAKPEWFSKEPFDMEHMSSTLGMLTI